MKDNLDDKNGGYWKGTVDEKLDRLLSNLEKYHIEVVDLRKKHETLSSKVNWIIGVGSGATFVLGIVLAIWKL